MQSGLQVNVHIWNIPTPECQLVCLVQIIFHSTVFVYTAVLYYKVTF